MDPGSGPYRDDRGRLRRHHLPYASIATYVCIRGTHKKTEPEANASDSVFLLISAATYSPTNTLRSTIGEGGLNCRVRHGTGCVPSSITTENLYVL